ncbi:hypothetical protein SALBM135S_08274 [Streptomyces alboniger]
MSGVLSFAVILDASSPRMGARSAAACSGASLIFISFGVKSEGSAVMSYASTLAASSTPPRSVMRPRSGVRVWVK